MNSREYATDNYHSGYFWSSR